MPAAKQKQIEARLGKAVLKVTKPEDLERDKRLKYRDTLLEELCKSLLHRIYKQIPKWGAAIKIVWNPRLRSTLGNADYHRNLIQLNPKLLLMSTSMMHRVLRHELAHLMAWNMRKQQKKRIKNFKDHGPEWRKACELLEIPNEQVVEYTSAPAVQPKTLEKRYRYTCKNCGNQTLRVRKIARHRTFCKSCEKIDGVTKSARRLWISVL